MHETRVVRLKPNEKKKKTLPCVLNSTPQFVGGNRYHDHNESKIYKQGDHELPTWEKNLFSDAGWSPQTNCVSKICAQAICDKTNCGQNVAIILAGKFMLVGRENMSTKSCGKPFLVQNLDVALDPCLVLRQPFNNLETHL